MTECLIEENNTNFLVGNIGTNKNRNYQARYVVSDFDCTYNIGTAVTYCLRSSRKHDTPVEDLRKAIAHLEFEIERLNEKLKQ